MSLIDIIRRCTPNLRNGNLILKAFGQGFEKSRSGVYSDNSINRKLKRVGQRYGSRKEQPEPQKRTKKQEQPTNNQKKFDEEKVKGYAKKATDQQLKLAVEKHEDENVKKIAQEEIDERNKDKGKDENIKEEKISKQIIDIESKIRELRNNDSYDIDEIDKIGKNIQKLIEDRKKLVQERDSLRKIPFKEYIGGFKDFSDKDIKEISKFYELESKGLNFDNLDEIASINSYREDLYTSIREYLSNIDKFNKQSKTDKENNIEDITFDIVKSSVQNISSYISKNKIKNNLLLNRRITGDGLNFFKSLEKGDIYEDKSFSSTSLKELTGFGDYNISILAKKNSNVANINNSGEYEYLIDKGSKFRVLDKNNNGIIVELL